MKTLQKQTGIYDFTTPNLKALAENINRVHDIAIAGNHSVRLVPAENCCLQDIPLLNKFYGFEASDNPDMIIEVMYSTQDVLNVFKTGGCEHLQDSTQPIAPIELVSDSLDTNSMNMLRIAINKLQLGVNDVMKIHALAKTIARIENCENIKIEHIAEAIQYRSVK